MTTSPRLSAPFVRSWSDALRTALVLGPDESIASAPPVHGEANAIASRASEQFAIFVQRLEAAGVKVARALGDAAPGLGNACADGAVIFEDGAYLMRPSDARARPGIAALEDSLGELGVPVVGRIEAPGLLDAGDVVLAPGTAFIGVPQPRRSEFGIPPTRHGNALGRAQFAAFARERGLSVVEVALAGEVARLRSVASPIDERALVIAPGVLDAQAFAGFETIAVPRGEDYGAGVLTIGKRRVIANLRFRESIPLLRKAKVAVDAVDLWEFGKLGITPSGLALALQRG